MLTPAEYRSLPLWAKSYKWKRVRLKSGTQVTIVPNTEGSHRNYKNVNSLLTVKISAAQSTDWLYPVTPNPLRPRDVLRLARDIMRKVAEVEQKATERIQKERADHMIDALHMALPSGYLSIGLDPSKSHDESIWETIKRGPKRIWGLPTFGERKIPERPFLRQGEVVDPEQQRRLFREMTEKLNFQPPQWDEQNEIRLNKAMSAVRRSIMDTMGDMDIRVTGKPKLLARDKIRYARKNYEVLGVGKKNYHLEDDQGECLLPISVIDSEGVFLFVTTVAKDSELPLKEVGPVYLRELRR